MNPQEIEDFIQQLERIIAELRANLEGKKDKEESKLSEAIKLSDDEFARFQGVGNESNS